MNLYERTRQWARDVNVTDPRTEFLCVVEEFGELTDATRNMHVFEDKGLVPTDEAVLALRDAIGDSGVTVIIGYQLLVGDDQHIETQTENILDVGRSVTSVLGQIAEGLRKPKKMQQALDGYIILLQSFRQCAASYGLDFERDCLGLVVPIIEARVKGGQMVNGTFVKGADL